MSRRILVLLSLGVLMCVYLCVCVCVCPYLCVCISMCKLLCLDHLFVDIMTGAASCLAVSYLFIVKKVDSSAGFSGWGSKETIYCQQD